MAGRVVDAKAGSSAAPGGQGTEQRLYALDALRAVAMLLGVVLHAAIPFMRGQVGGSVPFMVENLARWPAWDQSADGGFDLLVFLIHAFRMSAFFILAGFFAHLLCRKRGAREFIKQRLVRIGVPFLAAVLVIIPAGYAVWYYGWDLRIAMGGPNFKAATGKSPTEIEPSPMHLWFLLYLMVLYVVNMLALAAGDRIGGGPGALLARAARRLFASWWGVLGLTLVSLPPMLLMEEWTSDTPQSFIPEPHLVAYYGLFYLCGWLLYEQRDLLGRIAARAGWYLVLGLAVALPLMTFVLGPAWHNASGADRATFDMLGKTVYALLSWLLTLGVIGLFLRYFERPSVVSRYLSDSAYWMYLVHLPLVVLLNIWIATWPLPGLVKMVGVVLVATVLLLASYQLGVRYTVIGRVLNGPRTTDSARRGLGFWGEWMTKLSLAVRMVRTIGSGLV